ncbi:Tetratricopeptide repeat-containing protein [Maridesulfovibrio ferrireducens]|uniref:Tetratricopeptide repeat-containing protein n=1 Tax=Maridesulfovibrio ferrireducens TaxID=246191 RepID=A0A1G9C7P7_9BACT|nr:tetratricopeptide repeat protein [Maridesulfovibrio ferrireducens]SDK47671.1 Tetratricopeptide repeat-containing protein [Maridesulfovibrio ferrireducens]
MRQWFILIFVSLFLMVQGCEKPADDNFKVIEKARKNFISGFYVDSEKGFERYLQDNPQGKYRLEAWNYLVKIDSEVRHDSERGASLLEAMYLEFGHKNDLAADLKGKLAEMYIRNGQYKLAVEALEKSLEFPDQSSEQLDSTRTLLAKTFRDLRNYDLAIYTYNDLADSTADPKIKAKALYEMAHTLTLIQAWERAESELNEIIQMEDVPENIHAKATFMLADIYEQKHDYKKAVELLKGIVQTYPNPQAVRYKLEYLKKLELSGGRAIKQFKDRNIRIKDTGRDQNDADGAI